MTINKYQIIANLCVIVVVLAALISDYAPKYQIPLGCIAALAAIFSIFNYFNKQFNELKNDNKIKSEGKI